MSDVSSSAYQEWLRQAQSGSRDALGWLLSAYINYLRYLTSSQLNSRLRRRIGASDIVQETLIEAHRDFDQFRGASPSEFSAWLRQILFNNVHRAIEQHVTTAKRDLRREIELSTRERCLDSERQLDRILVDPRQGPKSEAIAREEMMQLATWISQLAPESRDVVLMRHVDALPFKSIGERIGKSSGAVRMIWLRAIEQLRNASQKSTERRP